MPSEIISNEAPETEMTISNDRTPDEDVRESLLRIGEYHLDDLENNTSIDSSTTNAQKNTRIKFANAVNQVVHYKRGESQTIRRVLEEIDIVALKRTTEGFNEVNFSVGVINCFLISYVFGAFPRHFWLLYLVEAVYMIPRKFYNMWHAKPLNQALYYLDFCWCMNFVGIIILFVLVISEAAGFYIGDNSRELLFNAALGVSCGVLMGANIVLPFVACLFHDVNSMTGLFIHLIPPMVMYTFKWHTDEIKEAWGVFNLEYLEEVHYFGFGLDSVAGCSVALYFMWWIPYVFFMLLGGINLPKKFNSDGTLANPNFDTVFHSTMRGGVCISIGKFFRGRTKADSLKQMEENSFDVIDFFVYMGFHMISAMAALCFIGYPCFRYKFFHLFMLAGSTTLAVIRGAKRYTYYSTKMYSKILRKQFAHALAEEDAREGYLPVTDARIKESQIC